MIDIEDVLSFDPVQEQKEEETKSEKAVPLFQFLNSILKNKENLLASSKLQEKEYKAYSINNSLSMHVDTILYADEMNCMPWLSKEMQYNYLLSAIPARFRKGIKHPKPETEEEIKALSKWYDVNYKRAEEIRRLLSKETIESITRRVQRLQND